MATLPHFLTGQTSSSASQPPQTPSPPTTTTTTTTTKAKNKRNKKSSTKTSKPPNKPRQRGMGVEQLERMRLQGLKETNGSGGGGGGGSNVIIPKTAHCSFSQQQRVNQVENYGIPVYNGSTGLMMMAGNGSGCRVAVDPSKGNGVMELSSIPNLSNIQSLVNRCDLCYNKKKRTKEEKLGFNLGLNLDFNMNINGLSTKMGGDSNSNNDYYYCSKKNPDEEVEVVAVHRRNQYTGNMVMEYEFFPGNKTVVGSSSKELGFSIDHHHHHHQASSSSSSIDLSLKLSF